MTSPKPSSGYWLSFNGGSTWHKATLDEWCEVERQCGFRGGRPATAGFTSGPIIGSLWDPQEKQAWLRSIGR